MGTKKQQKIMTLTPEQRARFTEFRDKWIAIGLSTVPGNHARAEDAMAHAYRVAGLEPPAKYVWFTSPLHGVIGYMILRRANVGASVADSVLNGVWNSVRDSVRDSVADSVWDNVGASVADSVWDNVWDSVRNSVWNSVGDSVADSVWNNVGGNVRNNVRDSVRNSVRDSVRASVWASVGASVRASVVDSVGASVGDSVRDSVGANVGQAGYGNQDSDWLSVYDYYLTVVNIQQCKRLLPLMKLALEAGWWWPFQDVCILTEKPTAISRDTQGRLHSAHGPALDYAGTWAIWAWHGVRVSESIIKGLYSVQDVLKETNTETKRAMIEILGPDRFFSEARASVVHQDVDGLGNPRRLVRMPMTEARNGFIQAVHVRCPSTGREYYLGVPSTVRTCQEAVAATFGLQSTEYAPTLEA